MGGASPAAQPLPRVVDKVGDTVSDVNRECLRRVTKDIFDTKMRICVARLLQLRIFLFIRWYRVVIQNGDYES